MPRLVRFVPLAVLCLSGTESVCFLYGAGGAIVLGFQHFILCLGTAVMIPTMLVPLMGGNAVRILSLFNFLVSYNNVCLIVLCHLVFILK